MYIEYSKNDKNTLLVFVGTNRSHLKFVRNLGGIWNPKLKGWIVNANKESEIEDYNRHIFHRAEKDIHRARSISYSDVSSVEFSDDEDEVEESDFGSSEECSSDDEDDDVDDLSVASGDMKKKRITTTRTTRTTHKNDINLTVRLKELEKKVKLLESSRDIPTKRTRAVGAPLR